VDVSLEIREGAGVLVEGGVTPAGETAVSNAGTAATVSAGRSFHGDCGEARKKPPIKATPAMISSVITITTLFDDLPIRDDAKISGGVGYPPLL